MAMMALRMTIFLFMVTFGISIIEISGIVPDTLTGAQGEPTTNGLTTALQTSAPYLFSTGLDDDTILGVLTILVVGAIAGFFIAKAYILLLFSSGWVMVIFYIGLLQLPPEFSAAFSAIAAIIYYSGYTQLKSSMGWQGIV